MSHEHRQPENSQSTEDDALAGTATVEQPMPIGSVTAPADAHMALMRHQLQQALFDRTTPSPRLGRFELLRKVGEGGMGTVYAAYDPRLQREVALKLLKPERGSDQQAAQGRLLREARALAQLAHPNVVTIYEVDSYAGAVVLAMELVRGPTLRQWLERAQQDWRALTEILLAVADGLAAAHELGLIHRDIKPDNILIGIDGRARIADFGLVRSDGAGADPPPSSPPPRDGDPSVVTRNGAVLGTPRYMAPEQLRGEPADAASDQFSFCTTAFEALYGQRPFAGDSCDALLDAIATQRLPSVAKQHPAASLLPALLRGMSSDRAARHADMHALRHALHCALRAEHPTRRRRWLAGGITAVAVTVPLAVAVGAWHRAQPAAKPADEDAYMAALHASQEGRVAKCVEVTENGPHTERVLSVRVACADVANDDAALRRACHMFRQRFPQKDPPAKCDPLVEQANDLRKAGRAVECFELLERSPPAIYRRVAISLCASDINQRSYFVRLCKHTQKHYNTGPCPDEIVNISP